MRATVRAGAATTAACALTRIGIAATRHASPELGAHDRAHLQIVCERAERVVGKLLTIDAEVPDETRGDCGDGAGPV